MGKKVKPDSPVEEVRLITLDDLRTREIKYGQRIESLKHCMHFIDDMLTQLEILNEQNRLLENWQSYLSCDGLPKPYIPPDIRLFFVKLKHFEDQSVERNIDWTLSVDDRSILTQDIFRIDKTRETVKSEKLTNFGLEYDRNINLALKVLKRIEYYLLDEKLYSQARPSILNDIKEQRAAVHQEIREFFNRFSYRVLCSETAYMEDVDARTAEYFYTGTSFSIHIWTLKCVPIRFEFLEEPSIIANLHNIDVTITIPFDVLQHNLTIRGLHFDFDHFSEHAKSYEQVITIPEESLNASITDLRDCLANEWKMQVELQMEMRTVMVQKRLEYDDLKKQYDDEQALKAKQKKVEKDDKQKKSKPTKLPREPPRVQENQVPDTWKEFLRKEQKEFDDFLKNVYHPDLLNLESHELNLKKYLILGGIYQFDFVNKPRHFDFNSFNMTWHENEGKLIFLDDMKIETNISRQSGAKSILYPYDTDREDREEAGQDPDAEPWFVIRMKLPEYLCLWGAPMPCHFEANVISYIEEDIIVPHEEHVVSPKHKKGHGALMSSVSTPATSMTAPDDNQLISTLRTSIYNIAMQASRRTTAIRLATNVISDYRISSYTDLVALGIDDFDLNFPLTIFEMRNLVRHCLPRIISSYKLPSEFSAEDREHFAKAKSAGGTLIRRHSTAQSSERGIQSMIEKSERTFSTSQQVSPERLFPLFPTPDELKMRTIISDDFKEAEPKTFYELVKKLDSIKRYYLARPIRTSNLPPFKPNLKVLLKSSPKTIKTPERQSVDRLRRVTRPTISNPNSSIILSRPNKETKKNVDSKKSVSPPIETVEEEEIEVPVQEESEKIPSVASTKQSLASIDNRKTFTFSRWTTQYIKHSEFDREERLLTIWTDRLGILGLAYKRYEQLPFRFWSLEPSEENPESEVVFTLDTQFAKVVLFITGDGVRGYVTDLQKKFVRNRPMYLVIEEPLKDFRELRKRFREKNLNIFTERDASYYIENGYFSQKHLATELHTYCCMCTHAQIMRFLYSEWNRLSARRSMVFRLVHYKESEDSMCTVRVTPEESTFVTVKELCSDDLDVFNLEYTLTWRNIDFYADLDHLITSMYPSAPEQRIKNPHLIYFLKAILWEIRPLSFS